jgi:hypothetical protein
MRGAAIRMVPALVALTCCGVAATASAEKASLVAVVVDGDTGEPIQGMPVKANFRNLPIQRNPWAKDELSFRVADKNGRCEFSGDTNIGRVVLRTKDKEPWYETQLPVVYTNSVNGRLQPDNLVVTVKVWKVGCPIPLIVKELAYYYEDDGPSAIAVKRSDADLDFPRREVHDLELEVLEVAQAAGLLHQ